MDSNSKRYQDIKNEQCILNMRPKIQTLQYWITVRGNHMKLKSISCMDGEFLAELIRKLPKYSWGNQKQLRGILWMSKHNSFQKENCQFSLWLHLYWENSMRQWSWIYGEQWQEWVRNRPAELQQWMLVIQYCGDISGQMDGIGLGMDGSPGVNIYCTIWFDYEDIYNDV